MDQLLRGQEQLISTEMWCANVNTTVYQISLTYNKWFHFHWLNQKVSHLLTSTKAMQELS